MTYLSFEEIKKDLDFTHSRITECIQSKDYVTINPYATKISQIVVWLMQNGYVEP